MGSMLNPTLAVPSASCANSGTSKLKPFSRPMTAFMPPTIAEIMPFMMRTMPLTAPRTTEVMPSQIEDTVSASADHAAVQTAFSAAPAIDRSRERPFQKLLHAAVTSSQICIAASLLISQQADHAACSAAPAMRKARSIPFQKLFQPVVMLSQICRPSSFIVSHRVSQMCCRFSPAVFSACARSASVCEKFCLISSQWVTR